MNRRNFFAKLAATVVVGVGIKDFKPESREGLYISPEALADMRQWSENAVSVETRKAILNTPIEQRFSVTLHDIDDLANF